MFGDIYPTKYVGKTTDTFGRMKFQLPQNSLYRFTQVKTYAASREGKIELLILVPDFMVKSQLKILNDIPLEFMECLNEDAKKKDTFCKPGVGCSNRYQCQLA